MSITFANAKIYVARALGAEGSTTQLAAAADAIAAAIEEWNLRRDWRWLLMDTRDGFSVASCTIAGDGVSVSTSTSNGFAGVNQGVVVTGTGIPASTTVSTAVALTTTTFTLSGAATPGTITMTFAGDIPVRVGIAKYSMPTPFKRPYRARLLTNERTLEWKDQFEIDALFQNQSPGSTSVYYNIFNPSNFTVGSQNGVFSLFPTPSQTDTARVRYYRPIGQPVQTTDLIDSPDRYVYALLEMARYQYLKNHDSEISRLDQTLQKAEQLLSYCIADDEGETLDRSPGLVAQVDHGFARQILNEDIIWGP